MGKKAFVRRGLKDLATGVDEFGLDLIGTICRRVANELRAKRAIAEVEMKRARRAYRACRLFRSYTCGVLLSE